MDLSMWLLWGALAAVCFLLFATIRSAVNHDNDLQKQIRELKGWCRSNFDATDKRFGDEAESASSMIESIDVLRRNRDEHTEQLGRFAERERASREDFLAAKAQFTNELGRVNSLVQSAINQAKNEILTLKGQVGNLNDLLNQGAARLETVERRSEQSLVVLRNADETATMQGKLIEGIIENVRKLQTGEAQEKLDVLGIEKRLETVDMTIHTMLDSSQVLVDKIIATEKRLNEVELKHSKLVTAKVEGYMTSTPVQRYISRQLIEGIKKANALEEQVNAERQMIRNAIQEYRVDEKELGPWRVDVNRGTSPVRNSDFSLKSMSDRIEEASESAKEFFQRYPNRTKPADSLGEVTPAEHDEQEGNNALDQVRKDLNA